MNILAAILILGAGASGSAEASKVSEHSIARIITQTAWGAINVGLSQFRSGNALRDVDPVELHLTIDGQPRTGFWSWLCAAHQVAGYATDRRRTGSVSVSYRVRANRSDIPITSIISDGSVILEASQGWVERVPITKRLTKEVPIHVSITIRAEERGAKTYLLGTATGNADTRDFGCWLVRSIANRTAAEQLDRELGRFVLAAESTAERWFAGGSEIGPALDELRAGIELGRRLRR